MVMALELRLHSPAGTEPNVYKWPLTSGRGAVSFDCILQLLFILFDSGKKHICKQHQTIFLVAYVDISTLANRIEL
jgi:hypothetical protein